MCRRMASRRWAAVAVLALLALSTAATAAAEEEGGAAAPAKSASKKPTQLKSNIIATAGEAELSNGVGDVLDEGGSTWDLDVEHACACVIQPSQKPPALLRITNHPTYIFQDPARLMSQRSARARRPARGGWFPACGSACSSRKRAMWQAAPCLTSALPALQSLRSTAATISTRTSRLVRSVFPRLLRVCCVLCPSRPVGL